MDLIQLKIEKDNFITKYIKIIRQFDNSLSINTIKQRIDANDFVIGFDLEYYDVLEDLNGTDRKLVFRNMVNELCQAGAQVSIYQDEKEISVEFLDNWLETLGQIKQQTEYDI